MPYIIQHEALGASPGCPDTGHRGGAPKPKERRTNMTQKERDLIAELFKAIKKLAEPDVAYVVGVAQGMAISSAKKDA